MITTHDDRHLFQVLLLFSFVRCRVVCSSIVAAISTTERGRLKRRCDGTLRRGDEALAKSDEKQEVVEAWDQSDVPDPLLTLTKDMKQAGAPALPPVSASDLRCFAILLLPGKS